jgi:hypothetical protein
MRFYPKFLYVCLHGYRFVHFMCKHFYKWCLYTTSPHTFTYMHDSGSLIYFSIKTEQVPADEEERLSEEPDEEMQSDESGETDDVEADDEISTHVVREELRKMLRLYCNEKKKTKLGIKLEENMKHDGKVFRTIGDTCSITHNRK